MRKILLVMFFVFAIIPVYAEQKLKIAVVDLRKLFYESELGKEYLKRYEGEFKDKEKSFMVRQETFERSVKEFEERKSLMKPEIARSNQEKLKGMYQNLERDYKNIKLELGKVEADYMEEVMKLIFDEAKKVAETQKYDYVFEKKSLLFGGEDITDKVIKQLKKPGGTKKEIKKGK